ncbi:MAG: hypothetical protein GX575_24670 [Candidatus Anammoximicrobium sp.]|nr:hypothetical protein [Candidatus Anammoximicrobium sp.]
MTIIACPRCTDSVVLPSRASQRATVRCPLCQEEFPLAEVLDKLPPELIVVDDPDAAAAVTLTDGAAPDVDAVPRLLEPEPRTGGFAPLSIETGDSAATTATATRRRRPAAPAKRKSKSPVAEFVKIVLGGVAGLVIAQVILWWIGSAKEWPSKRADISGLAPKIAPYVPWIVPERYRGEKPSGGAVSAPAAGDAVAAGTPAASAPQVLPERSFVNPNESASPHKSPAASGKAKSPGAKTKKPGKSQKPGAAEPLTAGVPGADPFGMAAPAAKPDIDLSEIPEPETDPLAEMKLDTEAPPDDKPVADPMVSSSEEEAKTEPTETVKPTETTETAETTKPPAQPLPNAPQKTAADLASAAEEAQTVVDAWRSASEGESRERIKQSYVALAKLGETLAYCPKRGGAELDAAVGLVQSLKAEDAKLNTLGIVAGGWLKASGRDNNGVLLVGVVKQVRQQGGYNVLDVALAGSEQTVAVYGQAESGEAPALDDRLLVLGAIVQEPGANLAGYEGDAPFVIWQGLWEKLPAP